MCKCKIRHIIIPMLVICMGLASCESTLVTVHCPAYPKNMTGFMPVQYSGSGLQYLVGKDTCVLQVEAPSLSKGYKDKSFRGCGDEHCSSTATQLLGDEELYSINYTQTRSSGKIFVQLYVIIGKGDQKKYLDQYGIYHDFEYKFPEGFDPQEFYGYEILPEYIAPTGKTYSNTLFFVDTYYKDSIWISYNEGLVRYVPAQADTTALGQVWQLL